MAQTLHERRFHIGGCCFSTSATKRPCHHGVVCIQCPTFPSPDCISVLQQTHMPTPPHIFPRQSVVIQQRRCRSTQMNGITDYIWMGIMCSWFPLKLCFFGQASYIMGSLYNWIFNLCSKRKRTKGWVSCGGSNRSPSHASFPRSCTKCIVANGTWNAWDIGIFLAMLDMLASKWELQGALRCHFFYFFLFFWFCFVLLSFTLIWNQPTKIEQ